MKRHLGLLAVYFAQFLKSRLAYKVDFMVDILASVIGIASSIAFLVFLFWGGRIESIRGWTRDQVLFIYAFSMVSMGLFSVVGVNFYRFSSYYIMQGRFDQVLTRPVSPLMQVLCEHLRLEGLLEALCGVGLMAFCARRMGLDWGWGLWLLLPVMCASGAAILISVFLICVSISFWIEDRIGITPPVFNVIQFGRYPVDIYHRGLQFFLRWVIPFGFIGFYPAAGYLTGPDRAGDLTFYFYLTPLVAAGVVMAAAGVWRAGIRRYHSTGS
jgi:ABC-2 type transport system permease protein